MSAAAAKRRLAGKRMSKAKMQRVFRVDTNNVFIKYIHIIFSSKS
jgi:hypothetical protein